MLTDQPVHHIDMLLPVGVGGIDHMEQQICIFQFFQCRPEGIHQVVGKLCDKTNGIGQDHIQIIGHRQLAGSGVQGIKKPVVGRDACTGQMIQKG